MFKKLSTIILMLFVCSCLDSVDIDTGTAQPFGIPTTSFCYATGHDVYLATNMEGDFIFYLLIDDYYTAINATPDLLEEVFPFQVNTETIELYLYRRPSMLTGTCEINGIQEVTE